MDTSQFQSIYHDEAAEKAAEEKKAGEGETGHVSFQVNEDGTTTLTRENGETFTIDNPAVIAQEAKIAASSGAALLAEIRKRRGSLIVPFEYGGRTWHLLKMDYGTINLVAASTVRQGDGTLSLDNTDVFEALVRAVLQNGVVSGPTDPQPYFNPVPYLQDDGFGNTIEVTELEVAMKEPELIETIATLFDKLTDLNPLVWPAKKKVLERGAKLLGVEIG